MYFLIAFSSPVFLNDFEYFIEFVHIRIHHAVSNMVVATYFRDQFFKTAILKSSSP